MDKLAAEKHTPWVV